MGSDGGGGGGGCGGVAVRDVARASRGSVAMVGVNCSWKVVRGHDARFCLGYFKSDMAMKGF